MACHFTPGARRSGAARSLGLALTALLLILTACSSRPATPAAAVPAATQGTALGAPTVSATPTDVATAWAAAPSPPAPSATRSAARTPGAAAAGLTIPTPPPSEGTAAIPFEQLPSQARDEIRLIAAGGPFRYRQDGAVFQNREGLLPRRPSGYYKEYTVETPGARDRGARRIIAGSAGELYYTDDHYASFKRVVP